MLISASGGVTLAYDPLGRLYQTPGGSTTRMLYDGATLIAEYDGSNNLLRRYVHGPGTDEPLAWYEGATLSTRRYLHADERGSIVAVADSGGNAIAINTYDEYGLPGASNSGRFQYTGQQWIAELGMYHYRARIYSPTLGRFMQTDPIGFGGGMNIYAYVGNDPMNSTDPSGLGSQDKPKPKCTSECGIFTGSRIPGNAPPGLFGYLGPGRFGASGGSLDLYKISEWDNATKTLISTTFDIRLGGAWAAQGGGGGRASTLSSTLRALLADPEVKLRMAQAWVYSLGDGPTGGKNEYGFWITPVGNDFRMGDMISGWGPFVRAREAWTPGATIFFHIHPFFLPVRFKVLQPFRFQGLTCALRGIIVL